MIDKLLESLEKMNVPFYREGSHDDCNNSFITFWNIETVESNRGYNDKPLFTEWKYQIKFYSRNPLELYNKLDDLIYLLSENGFIIEGRGFDLKSDIENFFCRSFYAKYRKGW